MLPTPPSSVRNPEQLPQVLNTWILFIGKQSLCLATVQQEWNYKGLVQSGLGSKPDGDTAPCHIHPGQAFCCRRDPDADVCLRAVIFGEGGVQVLKC